MKILFITHRFYPDIGGIEVNAEILAAAFSKAGHEVHLLTWSKDSTAKAFTFKVIRAPNKFKLFKEHKWADTIFENNPCLRLSWPSLFFGRPNVIAIRALIGRDNSKINFQDRLKLGWLKRAQGVIAVSEAIRRTCWPAATVIGNPYRVNEFRIIPTVNRTSGFVFLGRLVSQKGADLAILAIHRLITLKKEKADSTENPILTIVGDGPDRAKLERQVIDLNLTECVQFSGSLSGEALVICLNRHSYLLVPSIFEEAFGNVALEGMACGCLPIVSDCGGLPDAVGNAGLTFHSGNVNSLVANIQTILDNPDLEQHLRDAAPYHLAAHHPKIISHRYLEVIQKALGQKVN